MKSLLSFLTLTIRGGLLVLLPILLFILLVMEIVQLVVGLSAPIAGLFPVGTFEDPKRPVLLAVILIAGASLLLGIGMKSKAAKRLSSWIEEKTIGKLAIYGFVKALVSGLVGAKEAANFQPALFRSGEGQQDIVYVVEDLGQGKLTILCPHAPTGFAGPVKIVSRDHITPLDAGLGDVSLVMSHMGLGAGKLLQTK
jgi:uncharacterized membrane protein